MCRQVQRASWKLGRGGDGWKGRGGDGWKGSGEQGKSRSLGTLPANFIAVVGDWGSWDRAVRVLKW